MIPLVRRLPHTHRQIEHRRRVVHLLYGDVLQHHQSRQGDFKVSYLIRKGMAAKERIDKILGADNPIHDPERPVPLPAGIEKSEVAFRDVTFSYDGERDVLRDINLTVRPGETQWRLSGSREAESRLW